MVKLDSKEGFLKKGRNKEEKKDAYKKPGRATNTASEARTLRTLQVQNKRVEKREAQLNRARKISPQSVTSSKENGTLRMSRKDRLEQYRREKLEAQQKLKKKSVVPFRAGAYHPDKTIS